jgi:polysaccharide biosynthesis protein PslH
MGDILFLAHRFPYPPDRGDKIRSWHILKALAQIAPVHVATLVDDERDVAHLPVLENICASVAWEYRKSSKLAAATVGLLTGVPASVAAFASPALQARANAVLAAHDVETIFAFSGQMAQFVPTDLGGRRFVMDFVDVDSAKFLTYADQSAGLTKLANRFEGKRLAHFERTTALRADVSLFVSEAESDLFCVTAKLGSDRVQALENGIDLERYDPALPRVPVREGHEPLIVFTGQMDYRPNIDAVVSFARETLPLILAQRPDATFAIVGRAPAAEVRDLALLPGVTVTGEVPDPRDWLATADVVVAPLKLARGIQNKILEAMAMARPVVASPAAAEGIDAEAGVSLLVAPGVKSEAAAVLALLNDPARAQAMGNAARARMIARYSWDARLAGLRALVRP